MRARAPGPEEGPPLFLAKYGMNPETKLATEQARAIRTAQANGRTLLSWSVSLSDGRTIVVFAVTDRGARSLASVAAPVLRVGPARVRDMNGAIAHAMARVAPPDPRSFYVFGEGKRPAEPRPVIRRVAGEPRKCLSARCRPGIGEPIVGEYTLSGGRAFSRAS
jgi:hypothetical protein